MLPNSFILLEMRLTSRSNNGGELPIEIERPRLKSCGRKVHRDEDLGASN